MSSESLEARVSTWEKAFAIILLFMTTGAGLHFLFLPEDPYLGSPDSQVVFTICYGLVALLMFPHQVRYVRVARRSKLMWLLVGGALASWFWSLAPDVTLRRAVALLGTTLAALYLSSTYSRKNLIQFLAIVLAATIIVSMFTAILFPDAGVQVDWSGSNWKGLFPHKNGFGQCVAFSLVVWLALLADGRRRARLAASVMLGLSCFAMILSGSVTALVVGACLLWLWPIAHAIRSRPALALTGVVLLSTLLIVAMPIVASNVANLIALLGRDVTLTGRTNLWFLVLDQIAGAPWLGYGYNAFWLGTDSPAMAIWSRIGWSPAHSHNGFLDLTLQLGIGAIVVFGLILIGGTIRALRDFRNAPLGESLFSVGVFMFVACSNTVESGILSRNNIYWMVFMAEVFRINAGAGSLERAPEIGAGAGLRGEGAIGLGESRWIRERVD